MVFGDFRNSLRKNKYVRSMLSSGDQKNQKNQGGPPISLSDAKNRIAVDQYGKKKLRKGKLKSRETNRMYASLRGGVRKLRTKKGKTSKKRRRTKKARRSRRTKRR
jgi:hypothetical protein